MTADSQQRLSPTVAQALAQHLQGDSAAAESLCARAIEQDPRDSQAHRLLATVYQSDGKRQQAMEVLQRSDPADGRARLLLGNLALLSGDARSAAAYYQEAARLDPSLVEALNNLGFLLMNSGQGEAAERLFRQALQTRGDYDDAWGNLGFLLLQKGKIEQAIDHLRRAVQLRPDSASAHNNVGTALKSAGLTEEAASSYQQAIRLQPDYAEAINNFGLLMMDLGRHEQSSALLSAAVKLRPNDAHAKANLGAALFEQLRLEESIATLEEAMALDPNSVSAHWNRGMALMLTGDWERGWQDFTWWRRRADVVPRELKQPLWDGSPLRGRRILLHEELGLGDIIQFSRYAPLVKERGGVVLLECPPRMARLMRSCPGIDEIVTRDVPVAFDCHAPLMNLPSIFSTTVSNVPRVVPYLSADAKLVERWRQRLESIGGLRIGINWQGDPRHPRDKQRSIPLHTFAPLAKIPSVSLVSLQKNAGVEQIDRAGFPLLKFDDLDEQSGMFMDTAAIMKNLDVIVTVDSAVAHLAGALGVGVWLLVGAMPDWRWMLEREDTPWYPTMRLFRQPREHDWKSLFDRLARELEGLAMPQKNAAAITVEMSPGELLDRITILQIKAARFTDPAKRAAVQSDLERLASTSAERIATSPQLSDLTAQLRAVNKALWDVEDELRLCEKTRDFGPRFVELARSVYKNNDRRAALKRQIDALLGSQITEHKSYAGG